MKNFSRHTLTKFLAFILAIILIGVSITQILYIDLKGFDLEILLVDEYKNSSSFSREVKNAFDRTFNYYLENDMDSLNDLDYIFKFETPDGNSTSNREEFERVDFAQNEIFIEYENGELIYGENTNPNLLPWVDFIGDLTIYIAFTDEYMNLEQENWESQRSELMPIAITIISSVIISLILIIYLIALTGRKPADDELHSDWVDRIYTEILLLSFIPLGLIWLTIVPNIHYSYGYPYNGPTTNHTFSLVIAGITTSITASLCGVSLLALVRKIKDGRFIKSSFIYRVYFRITDFFKSFFDGRRFERFPLTKSLHQRQVVFIITSFFLVLLTFMFMWGPFVLLPPLLELVLIYWYVKYNNETYKKINEGFDESLEEQMKSERMKLELITNVSHDLKTPLTSIISYVDLLSKEEELSESAKDYVNILADKSYRLKNILSDLFDLAKSTSGDINLELETLDMKKLIEQTIGDMVDDIEKSGQQIKIDFTDEPVNIFTDGKKMYRVFQNVIDNALKYSLKGTRIFVELKEENGSAVATIKNTSNYEMDFTPDEILQRFNRGDKSRTTDGSGLGLSIAESFTRVSGGKFKIDIDGDMFKVIISFQSSV